jgi:hypothetical protein
MIGREASPVLPAHTGLSPGWALFATAAVIVSALIDAGCARRGDGDHDRGRASAGELALRLHPERAALHQTARAVDEGAALHPTARAADDRAP